MLYCKDCEKYTSTQNKEDGICSLPYSWQPAKAETNCPYLNAKKYYCKDCCRFGNDYACLTAHAYDSAEGCRGFDNKILNDMSNNLWELQLRGENIDEVIKKLVESFHQSEFALFVDKHKADIAFIEEEPLEIPLIKEKIAPVCEIYEIEKLLLFGSYARGDVDWENYVDFYLEKPGGIDSCLYLSEFRRKLEDCLGKEVNLITALDKESVFWKEISKDSVVVYGE